MFFQNYQKKTLCLEFSRWLNDNPRCNKLWHWSNPRRYDYIIYNRICTMVNEIETKRKALRYIERPIHHIDNKGWYECNQAVGNGVRGIASRNWKLVTCKNCLLKQPRKTTRRRIRRW